MDDTYITLSLNNGQEHHLQWVYTSDHTVELIYLSEWEDDCKYPKLELSCLGKEKDGQIKQFPCMKGLPVQKNGRLILRHWLLEADAPESGIVTILGNYAPVHLLTKDLTRRIKTGDAILEIDFSQGATEGYSQTQKEKASRQQAESEKDEIEEIKKRLLENQRKKNLEKQAYDQLVEKGLILNERIDSEKSREPIPQKVRDKVWNRDSGRCVICGSNENLEFDHIIPFSKGGATTYRNLQLLCQKCNRGKSNNIG
jgi:hypothetical protein